VTKPTKNIPPAESPSAPPVVTRFDRLYAPLLAFLLPLFAYLATMPRGLVWGDGIELAAVADILGIAHPTGYPLFTMIGHVFTWIPVGSVYWRLTLLCALAIAASTLILFHLLRALGERHWATAFPSPAPRSALALAGALTFAWSIAAWDSATRTEVYGVELLFQLGIAFLSLRVIHTKSARGLWAMAFLFALGMTHHMLTLTVAPFLVVSAVVLLLRPRGKVPSEESPQSARSDSQSKSDSKSSKSDPRPEASHSKSSGSDAKSESSNFKFQISDPNAPKMKTARLDRATDLPADVHPSRRSTVTEASTDSNVRARPLTPARILLPAVGFFILGLLPLLYLPIRASQSPALNWGNPSSWNRFVWVLKGGEFRQYRFLMEAPGTPFTAKTYWPFFFDRVEQAWRYAVGQVVAPAEPDHPLWVVLALAAIAFLILGIRALWRQLRTFTLALILSLDLYLFFLFTYNILDIRDYELGFIALLWPVLWFGLAELARWGAWEWRRVGESRRAARVVLLVFAIPLTAFFFHYRAANRSNDDLPDLYAVRLFKPLPPDAILLTSGDNDIYSAWYLQEVEDYRTDVLVYGSNFIFNPWYKNYFVNRDLKGRTVDVAAESPTSDLAFVQTLSREVIEPNIDDHPIYTTLDIPPLRAAWKLTPVEVLLTREEYERALDRGEFPPPPLLFRVDRPEPPAP